LDLVEATRNQPEVYLGASTRAALSLYRAAQGLAVLEKRDYVVPDDVKCLAVPVLAHRLVTRTQRQREGKDAGEIIIEEILNQTPVPV